MKVVSDGLNPPRIQGGASAAQNGDSPFPDRILMRQSRMLQVMGAKLTSVPEEVFQEAVSEYVHHVHLENNELQEIPEGMKVFGDLLLILDLANNQITRIPSFISQFSQLFELNLSDNMLSDLPAEFGGLRMLSRLILGHNRFDHVPNCIYQLKNLENLHLNDNKIKYIDANEDGLCALKHLSTLNLTNNEIELVPPQLGNMSHLKKLMLGGNRFRLPRQGTLQQGTEEVLRYLKTRIPLKN